MNILDVSAAPASPAPHPAAAEPRPAAENPSPAPEKPSAQDLQRAIERLREWLPEPVRTNLDFRVDDAINRVVVSVVNAETGTVVRQIPADVVIRVARNLQAYLGGLVDEVA